MESGISYLDNGTVRLGVDPAVGGAITYFSRSHSNESVVNVHDWGREIQQSYYSGPEPFGSPHPGWKNWPWNPISSGDVYGNRGRVLDLRNDGKTLYVKSVPMQWALNNVPGDCTFETWISLDGNAAHVRNRLTNARSDKRQYPAHDQELPAIYTTGKFHRLLTFSGDAPGTGAPIQQIRNDGPPWATWAATEHWAALVNDDGWGLGVFHPGVIRFIGGFDGRPNTGGPHDDSTGYVAPVRREILDHNIVYDYAYDLVLATTAEIRAYAVAHRPEERPDYQFQHDRQHWTYVHAVDDGAPVTGALRVRLDEDDPQLLGPGACWPADAAPKLYLRAAFHTKSTQAQLFWQTTREPGYAPSRCLSFETRADGLFHTYELDLKAQAGYRGVITGLRFDPEPAGAPGDFVELESLTFRKPIE